MSLALQVHRISDITVGKDRIIEKDLFVPDVRVEEHLRHTNYKPFGRLFDGLLPEEKCVHGFQRGRVRFCPERERTFGKNNME